MDEIDNALKILSEYTDQMEKEQKERQEIEEHLDTFIWNQQKQLYAAKVKQKVQETIYTALLSLHCICVCRCYVYIHTEYWYVCYNVCVSGMCV